ncbi:MAG: VanW family protein [Clostridia bacterium]|nr:VanW family protein [Clostridia bacterium]
MSEQKARRGGINRFVIVGIVAVVIIMLITGVLFYGNSLANADGIVKGVYINSIDLSGKNEEAAAEASSALAVSTDSVIAFECEDAAFELSAVQIGLTVNTDKAIAEALSYAKEGGFFKRVGEALSAKFAKKVFSPEYKCDEAALMAAVEENLQGKITPVTPYTVVIGEDKLTVTNGVGGFGLKDTDIAAKIIEDISDGSIDNTISLTLTELEAEPIDFEQFCETYIRSPKDAAYTETNGSYVFSEETDGIEFDKEQARSIIDANRDNAEPYDIPAVITEPEVTVRDLQIKFSTDCLASYSTSFASSDANRAANVELAASKINGVVLNPGERFSYNGVVGPRTVAAGFKVAHVYEGDRVVDGVGGGICQVSSTLYNTVLLADLKVVSRTNHSMPVGYVPLGRDATVSWGTIDFVFENNKKYPVKIVATSANRKLTISMYGVKEDDTVIEIVTENAGHIPFTTNETVDNSLKPGETKITKEGSNGSVVNTYKVYKKDGVVIDRKHTSKSTYIPVSRQVSVGPAPIEDKQERRPENENRVQNVQPEVQEPQTPVSEQPVAPAEAAPEAATPAETAPEAVALEE